MGGGVILLSIAILVVASVVLREFAPLWKEFLNIDIRFSLWERKETYLALFTLASV